MASTKAVKVVPPKKPGKAELLRRARLAGLLLETLVSQGGELLSAAARSKIADAAKLLANASQLIARAAVSEKKPRAGKAVARAGKKPSGA